MIYYQSEPVAYNWQKSPLTSALAYSPLDYSIATAIQQPPRPHRPTTANHLTSRYNRTMEIAFTPELEAKLNQIASENGRAADQFVMDLVATQLSHEEWLRREVENGLAFLDSGDFISHADVGQRINQALRS